MYIDIRIYNTPKTHSMDLSSPHRRTDGFAKIGPSHTTSPIAAGIEGLPRGSGICRLGISILIGFIYLLLLFFWFILQYYSSHLLCCRGYDFKKVQLKNWHLPSQAWSDMNWYGILSSYLMYLSTHPSAMSDVWVPTASSHLWTFCPFPTPPAHSKTRSQTKGNSRAISLPWIWRESHQMLFFGGKSTFEVFKFLQCVNRKFWRNTWQQGKPLWNHILTWWQLFQNQGKTGGNTSWDCNLNCTFHKAKDLCFWAWLLQIQCQLNTVNQMIYDFLHIIIYIYIFFFLDI